MSSNDNASQQVKGVIDNSTRIRDGSSVINNGSNESQIVHQKSDDQILLTSLQQQQQQQQFYHPHHQGAPAAHQQYTMYPSGVTYSIDPTQGGTNPGGLDYTMIQPQQIYQVPVYFSSETYHPQHGYEDPYQTSSSTQFQAAAAVGGVGGQAAAVPSQYHHHIQTAQYSGGGGEHHLQPQHHHPQQQTYMQQENNSQGIYPKPNATMFDNTAAKYTADWVSRTTLIPSEMKVPPDQAVDLVSHDSKVITPKNWGEGSYVVTTSSTSKPIASATVDQQQPLLDQQLAQLDITSFPFVSSQLSQPQQQQGVLGGGYAMNWPGTSQQQPQQQQIYRDQRAYNATGGPPKPQATSWADITRKGTNNNNNNIVYQQQQQQQQRPQFGGNANFQDQRGTQSAQPTGQSQIRHERSFTGPKNTFNQTGANNPGSFVRNVHRSSGNFGNNRGAGNNMSRGNNRSGGPPRQPQHNPSYSAPPQQQQFQPQQRGPLPSLLAQHRTQNFPRNNFGGQQQRPQGNNTFGFPPFGGGLNQHQQSHQQQHHQQQMPEFNPGVPPPALPNQFRQPIPPMMPPFPPPPFNMMNPQQQQQFFRAFISQVRPDAMMPLGPYGFDQFGQRFFNPGYPFGHHPGAGGGPPFGGQQFNNRFPNFNRGQRRGRGGGRFQQPRRNFQDQSRYNNSNTQQSQHQQQQQQQSPQDSANPKQLDPELADSVNRGVEFDRDETKTPEPKGDTETTGSPNEDKKDSPKDDDAAEDEKDTSSSSSSSSSSPTNANPTTTTTKTAETTT